MPGNSVTTWQASQPGVPGIDALHSFASDYEPAAQQPVTQFLSDPRPEQGPSYQFRVPDGEPAGPYYAGRKSSEALATQYSDTITEGQPEPQDYTERTRDPREAPIPVERWTARTGPAMYQFIRPFGQWQEFRFTGQHASMPTDAARGTRIANEQGFARFRTTQRVIPAPLDEQVGNTAEDNRSAGQVLQTGAGVRNWARPVKYQA